MHSGQDVGPTAESLFRAEALTSARQRNGVAFATGALSSWVLTGFMVMLVVAIGIALARGSYTRRATVAGLLTPSLGSARVSPLRPGVITQVFVREGDHVTAGAPLFEISTDTRVRSEGTGTSALGELTAATAAQEAAAVRASRAAQRAIGDQRFADIRERWRGLRSEETILVESLGIQTERERLAQQTLTAAEQLSKDGVFPALQLRQRQDAVMAAKQGRISIERDLARTRAGLAELAAEERKTAAEQTGATADAERVLAQIAERQAARLADANQVVVSPTSGRVAALQARAGSIADPALPAAIIMPPSGRLQAELWAPSSAVGFVRPGSAVRLMYDAFPYEQFGVGTGTVLSIAAAPTIPLDSGAVPGLREPLYRITVAIERQDVGGFGRRWALAPGMRLRADLILEKRSFWGWLTAPVASLGNRT